METLGWKFTQKDGWLSKAGSVCMYASMGQSDRIGMGKVRQLERNSNGWVGRRSSIGMGRAAGYPRRRVARKKRSHWCIGGAAVGWVPTLGTCITGSCSMQGSGRAPSVDRCMPRGAAQSVALWAGGVGSEPAGTCRRRVDGLAGGCAPDVCF